MNKMKFFKVGFGCLLCLLSIAQIRADEGMWLISKIDSVLAKKLRTGGLNIPINQLYSDEKASIKDAVLVFDNVGTAEVISSDGLIITNHHCGQDRIQQLSSNEHNYLKDGFWAGSFKDEIPVKGLSVRFLVKTVDVTEQVKKLNVKGGLRKVESELDKIYGNSEKNLTVSLDSYPGGLYLLSVYQIFNDVRLVGAPPVSIGNFGGDYDNFEWPRHSADFSLFRIYADSKNESAEYSPSNVPYHPKSVLPVSISGIKNQLFTMVVGFPFMTQRHITSYELQELQDVKNRAIIIAKTHRQNILKSEMDKSEAIRLKYAAKFFNSSNACKLALGSSKLIDQSPALKQKQQQELEFQTWANADSQRSQQYGKCLSELGKAYNKQHDAKYAHTFILNALATDAFLPGTRAASLVRLIENKEEEQLQKAVANYRQWFDTFQKEYDQETDRKVTNEMIKVVAKYVKKEYLPEFYKVIETKYKGDIDKYTNDLYNQSILSNPAKLNAFLKKPSLRIKADPFYIFGTSIYESLINLKKEFSDSGKEILAQTRIYHEGLSEKDRASGNYPDANFSMRLSYGKVAKVSPRDGLTYDSQTTLRGVMEKEDTTVYEYHVPSRLKELYEQKDYGRYGQDGEMYTCFLSTNDITGGNSGSPVLNANGELIGLAFDGNKESLASSVIYEPNKNRCINVDIRYVLFVIEKYAKANRLIDELTIR